MCTSSFGIFLHSFYEFLWPVFIWLSSPRHQHGISETNNGAKLAESSTDSGTPTGCWTGETGKFKFRWPGKTQGTEAERNEETSTAATGVAKLGEAFIPALCSFLLQVSPGS